MLFKSDNIVVRLLKDCEKDKKDIFSWLSDSIVTDLVYSELVPITMEKVEEHFIAKLYDGKDLIPCIIEYKGKSIGYVQFEPVYNDTYNFREQFETCDFIGGYSVDIFIGLPKMWGKEIGTKTVIALKEYLFDKKEATVVCADPEASNNRSIRCWEKAGFTKVGTIQNYDYPELTSILMVAKSC